MRINHLIERMRMLLKEYFDCQDEIVLAKFEQLLHEAELLGLQNGYEIMRKLEKYVSKWEAENERD